MAVTQEEFNDYIRTLNKIMDLLEQTPCDKYIKEIDHLRKYIYKLETQIVEQESVLEKIRTEIEQAADKQFQIAMSVADLNERYAHIQMENAYRHSLNIIYKYKRESEE